MTQEHTWGASACEVASLSPLSDIGACAIVATRSAVAGVKLLTEDASVAVIAVAEESALKKQRAPAMKQPDVTEKIFPFAKEVTTSPTGTFKIYTFHSLLCLLRIDVKTTNKEIVMSNSNLYVFMMYFFLAYALTTANEKLNKLHSFYVFHHAALL